MIAAPAAPTSTADDSAAIAGAPGWRPMLLDGRGSTFVYERPGPPGAPTVVLLHGWIATGASNWSVTLGELAQRYHVVALDHRGHGDGIRSSDPFTLEDCADDVIALLDALGVRSATLIGYSMGGPIAQLAWRRHPDRVDALVLYATAAEFVESPVAAPVLRLADTMVSTTLAAARPIPRPLKVRRRRPGPDGEIDEGLLGALVTHDAATIRRALLEIVRYDAGDWIGSVDVPTAVIVTGRDRAVSPARQRALAAAIPGAHVIELDGAHRLPFTDPHTTAGAIVDACDVVLGRPGRRGLRGLIARFRARRARRRRRRRAVRAVSPVPARSRRARRPRPPDRPTP